jgi:hypothetical protein
VSIVNISTLSIAVLSRAQADNWNLTPGPGVASAYGSKFSSWVTTNKSTMTKLLERAFKRASELPDPTQDAIAKVVLDQIEAISFHHGSDGDRIPISASQKRSHLVQKARKHWTGKDGLAYQQQLRQEWDHRPTSK